MPANNIHKLVKEIAELQNERAALKSQIIDLYVQLKTYSNRDKIATEMAFRRQYPAHQQSAAYVARHLPDKVVRCKRCKHPALTSDNENYAYQCTHCDEDLFEFETYVSEVPVTDEEKDALVHEVAAEIFDEYIA